MFSLKNPLITILCSGYALVFANMAFFHTTFIETVGFLTVFCCLGFILGKKLYDTEDSSFGFGIITLLLLWMILGTALYYIYGTTQLTSIVLLLLPLIALYKKNIVLPKFPTIPKFSWQNILLLFCFIILEIGLFTTLIQNRTVDVSVSPWQQLPTWFFFLYALNLCIAWLYILRTKHLFSSYIITTTSLFLTFSIAAIVYPLGFGFDGLIHRATESWIALHGFITPKQPFYIGQYSLIVSLHHLTSLSVQFLDVFFLPVFTALFLPFIIPDALKKIWNIPKHTGLLLVWVFPLFYFLSPNLTTPHNIVTILAVGVIFSSLSALYQKNSFFLPFLLALASLATHPLIGAILIMFVCVIFLSQKVKQIPFWIFAGILFFGITLFPVLMFTLNNYIGGFGWPALTNPLSSFSSFLSLFQDPYYYAQHAARRYELLYFGQKILTPLLILLGLFGFFATKNKSRTTVLFPLAFLGCVVGAFLLRSWIVFPNVAGPEQSSYPMRLLYTAPLFLLPWIMFGAKTIYNRYSRFLPTTLLVIACSGLLMITLYFSYPQKNPKVRFPGYNVTQADFDAVTWIHDQNATQDYVVLSNPLVSVAALTKYSFVKEFATPKGPLFYYAIPSGGPLYQLYSDMVYKGQTRATMQEALDLTGAKRAYFVIDSYWANASQIIAGAKLSADTVQEIDGGLVWVFGYGR